MHHQHLENFDTINCRTFLTGYSVTTWSHPTAFRNMLGEGNKIERRKHISPWSLDLDLSHAASVKRAADTNREAPPTEASSAVAETVPPSPLCCTPCHARVGEA